MNWARSLVVLVACGISLGAGAQLLGAEQQRFHAIYKELVETNTSHSVGDNTLAARRAA